MTGVHRPLKVATVIACAGLLVLAGVWLGQRLNPTPCGTENGHALADGPAWGYYATGPRNRPGLTLSVAGPGLANASRCPVTITAMSLVGDTAALRGEDVRLFTPSIAGGAVFLSSPKSILGASGVEFHPFTLEAAPANVDPYAKVATYISPYSSYLSAREIRRGDFKLSGVDVSYTQNGGANMQFFPLPVHFTVY